MATLRWLCQRLCNQGNECGRVTTARRCAVSSSARPGAGSAVIVAYDTMQWQVVDGEQAAQLQRIETPRDSRTAVRSVVRAPCGSEVEGYLLPVWPRRQTSRLCCLSLALTRSV
eukprot:scaffold4252_cov114-Isochrysis_galbana.AAC.1